ncbi:MAG: ATP-binding cassette domain-containing protein [Cytophagales bacterium]|nr:ATP-binding cassette domain-containing protein [Cytophagales bacterium]MDW8384084.1 ATP-binding cassette domain-containing protein [Flammeovirgaceae bacterium]
MIEIKHLNKSFADRQVLFDINATFHRGIVNMIIGASGTGKSVLLKCIVGIEEPNSGQVLFDGRSFYHTSRDEQREIRREIGMLFQGGALFDSKNVIENVRFPLDILMPQMPMSEKLDRVHFCLKRVGLENAGKKRPSELSGGMKKRVGIARAIVMQTNRYLFCDEPNSGLDPQTSIVIDNLIDEITKEYNLTTVVVSHDMNSMMEIGDHIIFIHQGRIVWEGSNENIVETASAELEQFIFSNKLMRKFRDKIY